MAQVDLKVDLEMNVCRVRVTGIELLLQVQPTNQPTSPWLQTILFLYFRLVVVVVVLRGIRSVVFLTPLYDIVPLPENRGRCKERRVFFNVANECPAAVSRRNEEMPFPAQRNRKRRARTL